MQVLQEQCLETKRAANSLSEENMKSRTRLRVLEREMLRRDKLLRQLALMKKAGQCVDMDIIEKLREERNMLPIVRKKAQELQQQVEAKDEEIRNLKRDPQFTRIIELQVEYATWQHEAKRLQSLLQEASPEVNNVARQEIEVHERRAEKLKEDLAAVGERKTKVAEELIEMEVEHASRLEAYQEKEKELQAEQEKTRELAIAFKKVLQDRKQVEQTQDEIEKMLVEKKRFEEELRGGVAQEAVSAQPADAPQGRASVSQAARSGPPARHLGQSAGFLDALRRAAAARSGEGSLFAEFRRRDADCDGLLSAAELADAFAAMGLRCSQQDLNAILGLIPREDARAGAPPTHLRWLDLLVVLDRTVAAAPLRPPLPALEPLRAACLRAELGVDEFQRRLCATASREEAEAFFAALGLDSLVASSWVAMWEAWGADGLLLRLPIGSIAIRQADFDAWFARCVDAVRLHRKDLQDSLRVWREDMLLDQDQFNMVCCDVLGCQLSQDDISDLALYLNGGSGGPPGSGSLCTDGGQLLRIEELRRPGAR